MNDFDWSEYRTDLAVCDCGTEFLTKARMTNLWHFQTETPCPKCGSRDRVHEIVWNEPIPRILHFFGKLFLKRKRA